LRHRFVTCLALAMIASPVLAQTRSTDKSQFTLLNPTPAGLMREMRTDRPDVTESPYTVNAGHLQIESSVLEYGRDDSDELTQTYSILPSNLRLGLTNNLEVALNFQPLVMQRISNGSADSTSGFGFTELRLKANIWGNDDGDTSFGIMPIVRLPTGPDVIGTDEVEPGIIAALAVKLTEELDLGFMAEVDFVRGPDDPSYETEFLHTITLGFPIVGELSGFIEYAGVATTASGSGYAAFFDTGVTYALTENIQLDGGVNIGLTDDAEDLTLFTGVSVRL
jgi:hypothetical protein